MAKFKYTVVKQDKVTVLVMTEGVKQLVSNALEVINPDNVVAEEVARTLALELGNE